MRNLWTECGWATWRTFGQLAERYERTLLAIALAKLHDMHTAEDVVQATLLVAFRRLNLLRDAAKFGPWLIRIAQRQAVDAYRTRRSPLTVPLDESECEPSGDASTPVWVDDQTLLRQVARLPVRERMLVGLRYFDGHSMAEIAAITGRSTNTVTKQLSRAVARLRSWFDKENPR